MTSELVQLVDEENRPSGAIGRDVMRRDALRYRASFILVFNSAGELYVQQRAYSKDMCPGWFDLAAGGVMRPGETYEENAAREVHEELGIVDGCLNAHGDFYYHDENNRVWGRIFSVRHDGPFEFCDDEVIDGRFVAASSVLSEKLENTTPDSVRALELYLDTTAIDRHC